MMAGLGILLLVVICVLDAMFTPKPPTATEVWESVRIEPLSSTELGVDVNSAFSLTCEYPLTKADLTKALVIEPETAYTLSGKDGAWTVTPTGTLAKGTVYTLRLRDSRDAVVQSFAVQTSTGLLVQNTYPAGGAYRVSVRTGIEIRFNAEGVDLSGALVIDPPVKGRLETKGDAVTFIPSAPLKEETQYTVFIPAGVKAPNKTVLEEDFTFNFHTEAPPEAEPAPKDAAATLSGSFDSQETCLPGDPIRFYPYFNGDELMESQEYQNKGIYLDDFVFDMELYVFPDAAAYAEGLEAYFNVDTDEETPYFDPSGLELARSYQNITLLMDDSYETDPFFRFNDSDYHCYYALLPEGVPEGVYLLNITPVSGPPVKGVAQKFIQASNLEAYTQSHDGEALVWMIDSAAGKPVADANVTATGYFIENMAVPKSQQKKTILTADGVTDADGIARLSTKKLENASYQVKCADGRELYIPSQRLSPKLDSMPYEQYFSALYTDRAQYNQTDTIHFWGIVKPRGGINRAYAPMPAEIEVKLMLGSDAVVTKTTVKPGPNGTFTGTLSYESLDSDAYGYCRLVLYETTSEPQAYREISLRIQDYIKPPYILSAEMNQAVYMPDDEVICTVKAAYYDGTPANGVYVGMNYLSQEISEYDSSVIVNGQREFHLGRAGDLTYGETDDWRPKTYSVEAWTMGEFVRISASSWFRIIQYPVAAEAYTDTPGAIELRAAKTDINALKDGGYLTFDNATKDPASLPVKAELYKITYVAQYGDELYDRITKTTYPTVSYEKEQTLVETMETTVVNGRGRFTGLPESAAEPLSYYLVRVFFGGAAEGICQDFYITDNRDSRQLQSSPAYYGDDDFEFTAERRLDYKKSDSVTLGLYQNNKPVVGGLVCYSVIQDSILKTGVYSGQTSLQFEERMIPNAEVAGAYFDGRYLHLVETGFIRYRYDEMNLNILLEPDRESYRPGDTSEVNLLVTDAKGNPVQGDICVGVVDEAVFGVAGQYTNLLGQLYESVYISSVRQSLTHMPRFNDYHGPANTGGGDGVGDQTISGRLRENFVDTALFTTTRTDSQGKASVSIRLPDNTTAWRITALAVTPDLKAGSATAPLVSTLPFYLRVLAPETYIAGDDLTFSATCVGDSLNADLPIDLQATLLDDGDHTLDTKKVSVFPGSYGVFSFGKAVPGQYSVIVSGEAPKGGGLQGDALKTHLTVLESALTATVTKNVSLEELQHVESLLYPVRVTVYDKRMDAYMEGLWKLRYQWGIRTEQLVGSYCAARKQMELLEPGDRYTVYRNERLNLITDSSGGIRALENGPPEPALTAKMLVAAPEQINSENAAAYLAKELENPSISADDRAAIYMGLAAVKKPVLLDIRRIVEQNGGTMTALQKLRYGSALAILGDDSGAQGLYDSFADLRTEQGDMIYLKDDDMDRELELTAAALILTSYSAHPDADGLMRSLCRLEPKTDTDVLYQLELLSYLRNFTLPEETDTVRFSMTQDGEENTYSLDKTGRASFVLTKEALKEAAFKKRTGKASASVEYVAYARQAEAPSSGTVKLEREYVPDDNKGFMTSAAGTVRLGLTFSKDAVSGCYEITDRIPSGMRYMPDYYMAYEGRNRLQDYNAISYHTVNDGQEVRLFVYFDRESLEEECSEVFYDQKKELPVNQNGDLSLSFEYRVICAIPGTYMAEPACVLAPGQDGIAAKTDAAAVRILTPDV